MLLIGVLAAGVLRAATDPASVVPTDIATLDTALRGGLPRGQLSEITGPRSSGRMTLLLQIASKARATDIHMEPKGEDNLVRMRVDGQMVSLVEMPRRIGDRRVLRRSGRPA